MRITRRNAPLLLLAAGLALLGSAPATAGCGCDHPPPEYGLVMPPFASPGKNIAIHPDGFEFEPGGLYKVDFGSGSVDVLADSAAVLDVEMPSGVSPGPVDLKVTGPGVDHTYSPYLFTALAPAPVVPQGDGLWVISDFEVSVTEDGTLLIPFNVSQILDPTQFMFQMGEVLLAFGEDDVVFYNEDGVDLTLFTLDVDDPSERQWGSYYGWNVEQDSGIRGNFYRFLARFTEMLDAVSDSLSYWRHEFHTYQQAHVPGGTHEVDTNGYHASEGTLHVDHDHLVLAVTGMERDASSPNDPAAKTALDPGKQMAELYVMTTVAENPIEPEDMAQAFWQAIFEETWQAMALEHPSVYDDDDD